MKSLSAVSQPPIRILFCIDKLVRGGTELQLTGLIDHLDRNRYTPYLLTIRPTDPALIPEDCQHLDLDVPKLFSVSGLRSLWLLVRFLRRENVQIVQTFFQDSTVFAGLASRLAGTPARIACFRDLAFWNNSRQTRLLRWIYPLMNGYLANAEVVLNHFADTFRIDVNRAWVIRNGFDATKQEYQEHTGETTDIGIVGNMTRTVKRTDLFIRAAGIVHQQYPDVHWHILGDGHLRPELERLAKELGISDRVIFTGRIEDVSGYLARLQVGVICSDSEGLSNALLEYMFRGVAAVATEVGGNTELVEHGVTGLSVPPDNPQALADALIRLIEQPEHRQKLARSARSQVEKTYSWDQCLAEHGRVYDSLLQSKKRELPA